MLLSAVCTSGTGCVATSTDESMDSLTKQPNVLLLCIDDLRPELGCYGQDHVVSPNIDRLARTGRLFRRHYVQAPTCGASRAALLTGRYGESHNYALFRRAERLATSPTAETSSLPAWFRTSGYTTAAIGKVSHHPGGRGGEDWNDDEQPEMPASWDTHFMPTGDWQHPRGAMHGLANGEQRTPDRPMAVMQTEPGGDDLYPDGLIRKAAVAELARLAKSGGQPFFLAVGFIRPHLPFGVPESYRRLYDGVELPPVVARNRPTHRSTWHPSREFHRYTHANKNIYTDLTFADEVRRHYLASVSYVDAQVGHVLNALDTLGLASDTIVVLWSDHGWHLGEHAVWGKHTLFEHSLRSPLILRPPGALSPGEPTDAIVESVDLFPTLCQLAGLDMPTFTDGRSLVPMVHQPANLGRPAISYYGDTRTIRSDTHRLIVHDDGYQELYEHVEHNLEVDNLADAEPDIADELRAELDARLPAVVTHPDP